MVGAGVTLGIRISLRVFVGDLEVFAESGFVIGNFDDADKAAAEVESLFNGLRESAFGVGRKN